GGPEFVFAAPLRSEANQIDGFVAAEVDSSHAAAVLARLGSAQRASSVVLLADSAGRMLAGPDEAAMAANSDLSQHPAVAAGLGGKRQVPLTTRPRAASSSEVTRASPSWTGWS